MEDNITVDLDDVTDKHGESSYLKTRESSGYASFELTNEESEKIIGNLNDETIPDNISDYNSLDIAEDDLKGQMVIKDDVIKDNSGEIMPTKNDECKNTEGVANSDNVEPEVMTNPVQVVTDSLEKVTNPASVEELPQKKTVMRLRIPRLISIFHYSFSFSNIPAFWFIKAIFQISLSNFFICVFW